MRWRTQVPSSKLHAQPQQISLDRPSKPHLWWRWIQQPSGAFGTTYLHPTSRHLPVKNHISITCRVCSQTSVSEEEECRPRILQRTAQTIDQPEEPIYIHSCTHVSHMITTQISTQPANLTSHRSSFFSEHKAEECDDDCDDGEQHFISRKWYFLAYNSVCTYVKSSPSPSPLQGREVRRNHLPSTIPPPTSSLIVDPSTTSPPSLSSP